MANITSNLEAFRYLEIKLINGKWEQVKPTHIVGDISIQEDTGLVSTVSLTLKDPGIIADPEIGGIEYPRMNPANIGSMRCRLSIGYARYLKQTRKLYEGFLKELVPKFPEGKDPEVELVFHCSGWELTRVRRNQTYPNLSSLVIEEEEELRGDNSNYIFDPSDRSWATSPDQDFSISLTDIIQNIFDSYGYKVEIKLPDEDVVFTHKDSLTQRDETDWGFLTRLGKEYGFGLYSDLVTETVENSDDITTVFKWFIVPLSEIHTNHYEKDMEFLNHRVRGIKIPEFNPITSNQFVMSGEPSVTVNSNWAFKPQLVQVVNEEGDEVYRLTEVDSNNQVVIYEIDSSKLNSEEADEYFVGYLKGEKGWDEAKEFFIKKATQYHGSDKRGSNRSVYQGIEVSFSTIGNPRVQIGFSYPIKGLGSFYSQGLSLYSLTHTVGNKWNTSYNFKMG